MNGDGVRVVVYDVADHRVHVARVRPVVVVVRRRFFVVAQVVITAAAAAAVVTAAAVAVMLLVRVMAVKTGAAVVTTTGRGCGLRPDHGRRQPVTAVVRDVLVRGGLVVHERRRRRGRGHRATDHAGHQLFRGAGRPVGQRRRGRRQVLDDETPVVAGAHFRGRRRVRRDRYAFLFHCNVKSPIIRYEILRNPPTLTVFFFFSNFIRQLFH